MTEKERERARKRLAVPFSVLVTPFEEDGGLDLFAFERLLAWQRDNGCRGVAIGLQRAEGGSLRAEEYETLIALAASTLGGRVPVVAGCDGAFTERAVSLAKRAYDAGAECLYCPPPAGVSSAGPGYFAHLLALSGAVPLPIISGCSPGRTAARLSAEQMKIEGVLGVAVEGGLLDGQLLREEIGDALLFSLEDPLLFCCGALGFDGALSPLACLYPRAVSSLAGALQGGRVKEAAQLQLALAPLLSMLSGDRGNALIKWALHRKGLCTPALRLPFVLPPQGELAAFEKACLHFERAWRAGGLR